MKAVEYWEKAALEAMEGIDHLPVSHSGPVLMALSGCMAWLEAQSTGCSQLALQQQATQKPLYTTKGGAGR